VFLKEGEERFVREDAVKLITLTGPPDEVLERVRALRDAGVDNLAVQVIAGVAILLASINVFGGFLVTRRMLNMFQKG